MHIAEDMENCYWVNFKDSRATLACNVPRNLIIVWPARGGEEVAARLNVIVEFNGKTTNGKAVCESSLFRTINHFQNHVLDDVSKVMRNKKEDIVMFASCPKDECFGIDKAYRPGADWQPGTKEWRESKGCEAPEKYSRWQ